MTYVPPFQPHPNSPTLEFDPTVCPRMTLRDGRSLAYAEYGQPDGKPIFLFHGTPGSRLDFEGWERLLKEYGLRGIAVDRPGMGRSDLQRRRRLIDWPDDVVQLADHLHLQKFMVLGGSGGGPHALVCGYALAERVERVVLMSSAYPVDTPGFFEGMIFGNRVGIVLGRYAPLLLTPLLLDQRRTLLRMQPDKVLETLRQSVGSEDAAQLVNINASQLKRTLLEAFTQGAVGVGGESRIHARPWGFAPEDVQIPVTLWHGLRDRLSPAHGVRKLAHRIPQVTTYFLADHGHLLDYYPETLHAVLRNTAKDAGSLV
ncbi:alpha/beta fold hydrolase [Deinococcus oregonensis]|uniref:Alpha/beta fold hydrolase n=1 Tax=Deinococcus oregonensis TaxID=1805970 RepID=A0ABV6B6H6_9DEIO